jgi:hypothetical protein
MIAIAALVLVLSLCAAAQAQDSEDLAIEHAKQQVELRFLASPIVVENTAYVTDFDAGIITLMDFEDIRGHERAEPYLQWGVRNRPSLGPCNASDRKYIAKFHSGGYAFGANSQRPMGLGEERQWKIGAEHIQAFKDKLRARWQRLAVNLGLVESMQIAATEIVTAVRKFRPSPRERAENEWDAAEEARREAWVMTRASEIEAEMRAGDIAREEEEDLRLAAEIEAQRLARDSHRAARGEQAPSNRRQ